MKEINYWQQFVTTGKIEDYLQYRANTKDVDCEQGSALPKEGASFTGSFRENAGHERQGGAAYAGLRGSDGHGAQGRADRRI